ncbi:hypothetical protein LINPERHAP1_LOCUS45348 [Linum perenne]
MVEISQVAYNTTGLTIDMRDVDFLGKLAQLFKINDRSNMLLRKIGTKILGYDTVERIWYVPPGGTLATDLGEINNDADAEKVISAAESGVVSLYMEATEDPSVVADNEDADPCIEHGYATSNLEAEVSGIKADEGFNHLIDDSDRTSDLKFHQAMENLGISGLRRRKVRATYHPDGGIEVDQLNESVVNGC